MENLDLVCAELGAKLGRNKENEKLLTDSLGVLEEQGVYAFFLYLNARGKDMGEKVSRECHSFLKQQHLLNENSQDDVYANLRKQLATDLDKLLFARDLLRQSLIYARYHAKAAKEDRLKSHQPDQGSQDQRKRPRR